MGGRAIWPGEPAANVGKPLVETLGRTLVEHRKCAEHTGLTGFHDQIRSRDEEHWRRHHRDFEMSTQPIRRHVGYRLPTKMVSVSALAFGRPRRD